MAKQVELEELIELEDPATQFETLPVPILTNIHLAELLSILETSNPWLKYDEHLEQMTPCTDENIDEPCVYEITNDQREMLVQITETGDQQFLEIIKHWMETDNMQDISTVVVEDTLTKISQFAGKAKKAKRSLYLWME
jgi:hypothetical protein